MLAYYARVNGKRVRNQLSSWQMFLTTLEYADGMADRE